MAIWQDLLWYGYAKAAGATSSGFTDAEVLIDLRGQIARMCDLPNAEDVTLKPVYG